MLQPLRVSRQVPRDPAGWIEATFRIRSTEGTIIDLLSLGPDVEVLAPAELREAVAPGFVTPLGSTPLAARR